MDKPRKNAKDAKAIEIRDPTEGSDGPVHKDPKKVAKILKDQYEKIGSEAPPEKTPLMWKRDDDSKLKWKKNGKQKYVKT